MVFTDFIREPIKNLIQSTLPVKFYWDRHNIPSEPYCVYQTEDLGQNHKLCPVYRRFLDRAVKVYDYSNKNQEFYPSEFLPFISQDKTEFKEKQKVIFYGLLTPRRREIILRLPVKVEIYSQLTWAQMQEILPNCSVLSIGSYDNFYNDTLRTTIALNLGANIITEMTGEPWYNEYLKNFGKRIQCITR